MGNAVVIYGVVVVCNVGMLSSYAVCVVGVAGEVVVVAGYVGCSVIYVFRCCFFCWCCFCLALWLFVIFLMWWLLLFGWLSFRV